jgi:hypothetical protein
MRTSIIINLTDEDFERGFVGSRPPSLIAPSPPKPRRTGERVAQVLMVIGLGVLATIAYQGATKPEQHTMLVEITRPLPAMEVVKPIPAVAPAPPIELAPISAIVPARQVAATKPKTFGINEAGF